MNPPSTARTAGRSDWAERRLRRQSFILLSFSSSEKPQKRRKRSHTNVSNTLVARPSTPPAQTPQRSFRGTAAGTHLPSPTGSHTAAHTVKQGCFGRGWYHYPRSVPHVHKHPRAGYQNGVLCRFGILAGKCSRRTQKAFGTAMRLCVSLSRRRRGPAGLRDLFRFCRNCGLYALFQILLSVLQTLQLVPFLCKLRLSSFLFGSEFNGFRSKQAGFFAIIFETV